MSEKSEKDVAAIMTDYRARMAEVAQLPPEVRREFFTTAAKNQKLARSISIYLIGKIAEDGGATRQFVRDVLSDAEIPTEFTDAILSVLVHEGKLTEDESGILRVPS